MIVPFPFSDLSETKRRPALVLVVLPGDDLILCQITSRLVRDASAVALLESDFRSGSLRQPSNIRPNRLFTADRQIIRSIAGQLSSEKLADAIAEVIRLLQG